MKVKIFSGRPEDIETRLNTWLLNDYSIRDMIQTEGLNITITIFYDIEHDLSSSTVDSGKTHFVEPSGDN